MPLTYKEDLLASGVSSEAADGIIQLFKDLETFIKTQPKADRDAFAALLLKKKDQFEAGVKKGKK